MSKVIIVTGASSGIGKAFAENLAFLNFQVIAVARAKTKLEDLQKQYPHNIKVVVADITKDEDRLKIKDTIKKDQTGIYLINNAGIAIPRKFSELTETEWDQHYLVNTKAPIFLTQLLLPHLQNGGRVLNISSGLAHNTLIGMSAYGISKSALYMWKEYCNTEFEDKNISFGSVMPGVVDTAIQQEMRTYDLDRFPAVEIFKGFHSRNELLRPETVAKFITWLLLNVDNSEFKKNDWDIYDASHHSKWAQVDEVKIR
jgi:benzil reductase ((S)-benzoin forming)